MKNKNELSIYLEFMLKPYNEKISRERIIEILTLYEDLEKDFKKLESEDK